MLPKVHSFKLSKLQKGPSRLGVRNLWFNSNGIANLHLHQIVHYPSTYQVGYVFEK